MRIENVALEGQAARNKLSEAEEGLQHLLKQASGGNLLSPPNYSPSVADCLSAITQLRDTLGCYERLWEAAREVQAASAAWYDAPVCSLDSGACLEQAQQLADRLNSVAVALPAYQPPSRRPSEVKLVSSAESSITSAATAQAAVASGALTDHPMVTQLRQYVNDFLLADGLVLCALAASSSNGELRCALSGEMINIESAATLSTILKAHPNVTDKDALERIATLLGKEANSSRSDTDA